MENKRKSKLIKQDKRERSPVERWVGWLCHLIKHDWVYRKRDGSWQDRRRECKYCGKRETGFKVYNHTWWYDHWWGDN